jgi:hypothetical protein
MYAIYQSRVWGHSNDPNVVGENQLVIGTALTPGL